jgi:iron complex transport system ATP-binding protein
MKRKEVASYIGFFSQKNQIYFPYTVYETVMQGRYLHTADHLGNHRADNQKIVDEVLTSLNLTDIADESITKLSGGQLQRVMLARCIAQKTPVLILDEPMNHLDMKVQSELMDYLSDWRKKRCKRQDHSARK